MVPPGLDVSGGICPGWFGFGTPLLGFDCPGFDPGVLPGTVAPCVAVPGAGTVIPGWGTAVPGVGAAVPGAGATVPGEGFTVPGMVWPGMGRAPPGEDGVADPDWPIA